MLRVKYDHDLRRVALIAYGLMFVNPWSFVIHKDFICTTTEGFCLFMFFSFLEGYYLLVKYNSVINKKYRFKLGLFDIFVVLILPVIFSIPILNMFLKDIISIIIIVIDSSIFFRILNKEKENIFIP
ncbi:hypothetical protein ACETAC_01810 [Aceticella autotrophica]|uniref:Uncharacterized protein n=1 Tax=Aceticella autotrophica TaxID=2755338 RepID=A0A975AWB7_9THEO|nr:hypothetical protein [Aceticella autotrophica]QSZ27664.1 hypothetical protein ACETAC_01810 [Aceticella autotrophica]